MKKFIIMILLLFSFLVLVSCKEKNEYLELTELNENQVFTQKEEEYYIYFHKDNCSGCASIITDVQHYNYLANKDSSLRKIYAVNLQKEGEMKAFIYRTYTGLSGQGEEGNFKVNTITEWNELYIAATPTLIVVKVNKDNVKTSHYIAHGASSIKEYLGGLYE